MSKYQKSKKQVLFVFLKASLLQKMRSNGSNGEEFYCFEANFQIAGSLYFPIHFAIFREIGPNFETPYLGNGDLNAFINISHFFGQLLHLHLFRKNHPHLKLTKVMAYPFGQPFNRTQKLEILKSPYLVDKQG